MAVAMQSRDEVSSLDVESISARLSTVSRCQHVHCKTSIARLEGGTLLPGHARLSLKVNLIPSAYNQVAMWIFLLYTPPSSAQL